MFSKIYILLATVITIAGCSNPTPPVVRPPGSYTAINLPALSEKWMGGIVQLVPKNKNGCAQFSSNILPATIEDDYTVDIEGNRDIFFHISRADTQTQCNIYGMFYSTKGNEYTVKFEIKNKQCDFAITEKKPNGTQNKLSTYPAYVSIVDGIKVCENKDKLY